MLTRKDPGVKYWGLSLCAVMAKVSLTGIKPTGVPHLGNFLGSIQPALEMSDKYLSLYFIADMHALTTIRDGKTLSPLVHQLAATWLACGLDPKKVILFKQSQVPEITELNWYLSCFMAKGVLNRSHAYKAMTDMNGNLRQDADHGVSVGLYTYPSLMAADILLFGSDVVPVGQDQQSHIEIAKDIAGSVNYSLNKKIFNIPQAVITEGVETITGTDGRKMSKTYNNTIPIFAPHKERVRAVMSIVTDSKEVNAPKDPDTCNVFNIYKHFASDNEVANMRRYYAQGMAYSDVKFELAQSLGYKFQTAQKKYDELMLRKDLVDEILGDGAEKAREIASRKIGMIRRALGTA